MASLVSEATWLFCQLLCTLEQDAISLNKRSPSCPPVTLITAIM